MQKSLIAALVAGAFISLPAAAADLLQVYKQALTNDATIASARAALAAGHERTPQGLAGLLPSVGLQGTKSRSTEQDTVDPFPQGPKNTSHLTSYGISLTQPLFRWDRYETYQQSKLAEATAEVSYAQAQQDLITRVAQAYFDVLAAQDALESTQAQKTAVTEQLASAKRNFEVGTQTITDTHEAQARYDLTVAQEFAAINDLEVKRTALQAIIGQLPANLSHLKPGVTLQAPSPAVIDEWVGSAEKQNYTVQGAGLSLENAKHQIGRARAGHMPTVDLNGTMGRAKSTTPDGSGSGKTSSLGVTVNVPLFSGFAVTSQVRESIALEDKARNDLEAARRSAAQAARTAFLGVNSGLAQVKALEAAEVSSQSALDSNKLGYQVGVRINIDVLNAQQQLYSTRTNLAKARYDTILNGLRLKAAAGSLKEDDLVAVNNLLQN